MTAATTASAMSPNLLLNEQVAALRSEGLDILHLGFGEARLPLLPEMAEVLRGAVCHTGYPPVAGTPDARSAVAGWFERRGTPTRAEQVVLGPGTKPLLFATMAGTPGEVYVGAPSWNSYAPQARLAGGCPSAVPVGIGGGAPDPSLLRARIETDVREGRLPRVVVVNSPDNPTGTHVQRDVLLEICRIARDRDLLILSDEIYADLAHPGTGLHSAVHIAPERTVAFTGLSKSLAVGGWRIGAARFPEEHPALRQRVVSIASDIWSSMPAPMQDVAAYAFDEPAPVRERLECSRRLYAALGGRAHEICLGHGARVRRPTGAFYLYVDLEAHRGHLAAQGITDARSLAHALLVRHHIAVLDGAALGDDPATLAFKIATTGFVGDDDEEQRGALKANDAALVSHVAARLDRFDAALSDLLDGAGR